MSVKLLIKAKLQPRHIADMFHVSRVTASRWLNGHASPHRMLGDRMQYVAEFLRWALAEKLLPFPKELPELDEIRYLRKIINHFAKSCT